MANKSDFSFRVLRYPEWQPEFEAVLKTSEREELEQRLTVLETVIFNRMQELAGRPNCEDERHAMESAVAIMRQIQCEKLGFPSLAANDGPVRDAT